MALINCPECGKEISDKAKQCIHCGFPLDYCKKLITYDVVITSINKKRYDDFAIPVLEKYYGVPKGQAHILLSTPGNVVLQGINETYIEYLKYSFTSWGYNIDFIPSNLGYINPINSLIEERAAKWKERQKSAIKCPTCGSTNTQKISTTSKVVGAATFGLFSKTARSQFKCNHCGYKW